MVAAAGSEKKLTNPIHGTVVIGYNDILSTVSICHLKCSSIDIYWESQSQYCTVSLKMQPSAPNLKWIWKWEWVGKVQQWRQRQLPLMPHCTSFYPFSAVLHCFCKNCLSFSHKFLYKELDRLVLLLWIGLAEPYREISICTPHPYTWGV